MYTPIHASWLNQIEIWFGILHKSVLEYGSFESVQQLVDKVRGFIQVRWEPTPYTDTLEALLTQVETEFGWVLDPRD